MTKETKLWLTYSHENIEAAEVLLESMLYNPCLQNIQQSIEKSLKSIFIEKKLKLIKSHSIFELVTTLNENNVQIDVSEDECDLLDSVYLPSKYPVGSVLPDFEPDRRICQSNLAVAKRVYNEAFKLLK